MLEGNPIPTEIDRTHFLSPESLLVRAAAQRGLTIEPGMPDYSRPIASLPLERGFLKQLRSSELGVQPRKDGILTISGKKDDNNPEWAYWWNLKGRKHRVLPRVHLIIDVDSESVELRPRVDFSSEIVSPPTGQSSHRLMAEEVVKYYGPEVSFFQELMENCSVARISFEEIGMGGTRTLEQLFHEWTGNTEILQSLARSNVSPFKPSPEAWNDPRRYFLPRELKDVLFEQWKRQLEAYKESLSLP
jgi:hypothetical protein